ncbi:putative insulin-like peptide receptor-like, partial [Apostichopus japonicus]
WEVFTFGQQPYPARTNIEVLKFVTEGGRLDRPQDCVDDMYALMMKCWEKSAKVRPSFLIILDRCENFRRKSYGPGYDNDAFLDEKINYSKVNQSLNTDDYLEPMDKNDVKLKQKPPSLVVDDNGNAKVPASGEKKRDGSFRRLLQGEAMVA